MLHTDLVATGDRCAKLLHKQRTRPAARDMEVRAATSSTAQRPAKTAQAVGFTSGAARADLHRRRAACRRDRGGDGARASPTTAALTARLAAAGRPGDRQPLALWWAADNTLDARFANTISRPMVIRTHEPPKC